MATLVEILTGRICPYCGNKPKLVNSSEVNGDLNFIRPIWACIPCGAYVGCHKGTEKPLGRLANAELRQLKQEAHAWFDPLWKKKVGHGTKKIDARRAAYGWLARQMRIDKNMCHIGMFDPEQCRQAIAICKKYYPNNHHKT